MITPVDKKYNKSNLIRFSKILNENNIFNFSFHGVMLGFHRNNDVLDIDDDIDFLINRDDCDKIMKLMESNKDYFCSVDIRDKLVQYCLIVDEVKTYVDLSFYEEKEDYLVDKWGIKGHASNELTHLHIPKNLIFDLTKVEYNGSHIFLPKEVAKLCEWLYGEKFETPMKKIGEYTRKVENHIPVITYL